MSNGENIPTSFHLNSDNVVNILGFFLPVLSAIRKWAERNDKEEVYAQVQHVISSIHRLIDHLYEEE